MMCSELDKQTGLVEEIIWNEITFLYGSDDTSLDASFLQHFLRFCFITVKGKDWILLLNRKRSPYRLPAWQTGCDAFPQEERPATTVDCLGDDRFKLKPHLWTEKLLSAHVSPPTAPRVTSLLFHFLSCLSWRLASRTIWTLRLPGSRLFPDLTPKKFQRFEIKQEVEHNSDKSKRLHFD